MVPTARAVTLALVVAIGAPAASLAGRQSILEGPITLKGLTTQSVKFHVPGEWMVKPRLEGRLTVSGGGRRDIEVYLLRDADVASWEKNRKVTPLHATGRVDTVELSVPLPGPGAYVVVLSNRFSKVAGKEVAGGLALVWEGDDSTAAARPPVARPGGAPLAGEPPAGLFEDWLRSNGAVRDGPLAIRRMPGPPPELGPVEARLADGAVTYTAHAGAGVVAYDSEHKDHYAVFHPTSASAWPTALARTGPWLAIGTRGEGVAFVHLGSFRLVRGRAPGAADTVRTLEAAGGGVRVNDQVTVEAPGE